jgi:RNA polymerase sigma factor (sigma-70 family)
MDLMSISIDDPSRSRASLLIEIRDPSNHRARAEFDRRYGPMIRGWCRRWFPRETEGRVQDVYCKLVDRLRKFEYEPARGRFRDWLVTLADRLMTDLKEIAPPARTVDEDYLERAEAGLDLCERLAAEYDLELLEMAGEDVRARLAEQTWWAYFETAERGRDPAEVARELGIKVGEVYQARHRVITDLRREIATRDGLFDWNRGVLAAACPTGAELGWYLTRDGSLGPALREQIEAHVETCRSCQAALDRLIDQDIPPAGTTLPRVPGFRVYRRLGSGGHGDVWLAQDLDLPRIVAVKTLKAGADPVRRDEAMEVLRRDAHLLADVNHPNVVRLHAWLTIHDHHYLVMQYVPGGSLADLLNSEGPLDWRRAARYMADVGEGLLEVHGRGIVHRDVKPANILWDPRRDEALLTDFGVAARLADPASVVGSLPYMAPEAFDGRVAPSMDVYGLAATFFHLVTGSPPFPGSRIVEVREQALRGLLDPEPRCAGLPEPLERIIRDGLAADPGRRCRLKEFVTHLRGTLNQILSETFPIGVPPAGSIPSTGVSAGSGSQPPGEPASEREPPRQAPVDLRLLVSRQVGPRTFVPVVSTPPRQQAGRPTRGMRKVPPPPEQSRLRTGDRVRIEVCTDRAGFLTVFNVGPTGDLNVLHPDGDPLLTNPPRPIEPNQPLHIADIEMSPPAGRERLFAVWRRQPLPLGLDQLLSLVGRKAEDHPASRPYVATRDMKRFQQSVQQLPPEDLHWVVLELDHVP